MTRFLKSTLLWQFTGGFVIGAIGLFALHPALAGTPAPDAPTHVVSQK